MSAPVHAEENVTDQLLHLGAVAGEFAQLLTDLVNEHVSKGRNNGRCDPVQPDEPGPNRAIAMKWAFIGQE